MLGIKINALMMDKWLKEIINWMELEENNMREIGYMKANGLMAIKLDMEDGLSRMVVIILVSGTIINNMDKKKWFIKMVKFKMEDGKNINSYNDNRLFNNII